MLPSIHLSSLKWWLPAIIDSYSAEAARDPCSPGRSFCPLFFFLSGVVGVSTPTFLFSSKFFTFSVSIFFSDTVEHFKTRIDRKVKEVIFAAFKLSVSSLMNIVGPSPPSEVSIYCVESTLEKSANVF